MSFSQTTRTATDNNASLCNLLPEPGVWVEHTAWLNELLPSRLPMLLSFEQYIWLASYLQRDLPTFKDPKEVNIDLYP